MNIRERRIELGYKSLSEFCERNGFNVGNASQVENGMVKIKKMTPERQQLWADALECTVDELLKDDDKGFASKCVYPCKTRIVDKAVLEIYLKKRWGDKIGKAKPRENVTVISKKFNEYAKENYWNVGDSRIVQWGR